MREECLHKLLVLDDDLTDKARAVYGFEYIQQWVFRPSGPHRHRMFFVWLDDDRSLGGTRCRDDTNDQAEPWQWHAHLPEKFLRALLGLAPQEEVAEAIAKTLIN